MKQVHITVKTQVAGIHCWRDCPISDVFFLANDHRHMFYVYVDVPVTHNDRDLEFFVVQNEINKILKAMVPTDDANGCLIFGSMSCEMIADVIVEELLKLHPQLTWLRVSVSEDKENGGTVTWTKDHTYPLI